jgi:hypothetical protein
MASTPAAYQKLASQLVFLAKLEDYWLKLRLSEINVPASNKLVLLAGDKTAYKKQRGQLQCSADITRHTHYNSVAIS